MILPWSRILIGLAIAAALAWVVFQIREDGARSLQNAIERANNEAANNADTDRLSFDDCPLGMWDFGAKKCRGTP